MTRLALSVGDPAGVGPRVALEAANALPKHVEVSLFSDAALLSRLATEMPDGISSNVSLVDVGEVSETCVQQHAASAEGGTHQLLALERATTAVMQGDFDALVTGPISKEAITLATGSHFSGHTEYLAKRSGQSPDSVTMLFLGPRLKVALVTTHLGIKELPEAVTAPRIKRSVQHLVEALRCVSPDGLLKIAVTGLNPHAGERGLFGREEIKTVAPALAELARKWSDIEVLGPLPAESVFRAAKRKDVDGVVAMFHDQATIASKLLDWGNAVNVTWGLPFIRTSVDHGVAYDAAAAGKGDSEGMAAALSLALGLCAAKREK